STRSLRLWPTPSADASPLSLHDALPIFGCAAVGYRRRQRDHGADQDEHRPRHRPVRLLDADDAQAHRSMSWTVLILIGAMIPLRSEEHTSELQSRENLVCRLLLEKKKNK